MLMSRDSVPRTIAWQRHTYRLRLEIHGVRAMFAKLHFNSDSTRPNPSQKARHGHPRLCGTHVSHCPPPALAIIVLGARGGVRRMAPVPPFLFPNRFPRGLTPDPSTDLLGPLVFPAAGMARARRRGKGTVSLASLRRRPVPPPQWPRPLASRSVRRALVTSAGPSRVTLSPR